MKFLFGSMLCLSALAMPLRGQQPADAGREDKRLVALRLQSPVRVDGILDEAVWKESTPAGGFVQSEPYEGKPATEESEVRVVYDSEALYFGITCHESEPGRIIINDLKEDFNPRDGDSFEIILDTFNDDRNGFLFVTNPAGAKLDAQLANDGREINTDWDSVWAVRSRINDTSWSAEVMIPFRTLRFRKGGAGHWGINFMRRIRRKNEVNAWVLIPRRYLAASVGQTNNYRVSLSGDLVGLEDMQQGRNLKVKPFAVATLSQFPSRGESVDLDPDGGIDAKYGVTSDLTLDASLNTDFSQVEVDEQQINLSRFALFFPEKRDFFLENSGIFLFGDVPFERGQAPFQRAAETQLFFSRKIGLSDDLRPIPIRGGGRLTGRLGSYGLGLLNLQTKATKTTPPENFAAFRLKREIFSSSDVGVIFLNRRPNSGRNGNQAFGLDGNLRFFQNLTFNSFLAKTGTPGRPGDEVAWKISSQWRDNFFRGVLYRSDLGKNFNPGMGFLQRPGIRASYGRFEIHPRPKGNPVIRELYPSLQVNYDTDHNNRILTKTVQVAFEVRFQDGGHIRMSRSNQFDRLDAFFRVRPDQAIPPGDYTFRNYRVEIELDTSKRFAPYLAYSAGGFYNGDRKNVMLAGTFRPSPRHFTTLQYTYNDVALPGGSFSTHLLSLRANYSFNTRAFLAALIQYNGDTGSISSNIRFNVIHRPLSDIFVVYNEERGTGGMRYIDKVLALKYTHLFDF